MKLFYLFFLFIAYNFTALANNYKTPGTGVKWNMNNIVASSGGDVVFEEGVYKVNDTIFVSLNDTLLITSDMTVKFKLGTYFDINGVLLMDPPNNVTFTELTAGAGFLGIRVDSSNGTILKKLTLEYASALRLADCNIVIDRCIFRYNTTVTTMGSSAITLFRSNPIITNSQFTSNKRAAISGGANINNAPQIINCDFFGNAATANLNIPQISLGASGSDTVKISNNRIIGNGFIKSGGISFLPVGTVNAVVSNNIIKKNRYGIVYNGGAIINSITSYNVIDSNNIEADPNLGGSGINYITGATSSAQNSIATGNIIRGNLWGITIQGRAQPNLGNITNTDTADNGKNQFIDNTNASTPLSDLYNSTPDEVYAQNNYWNTDDVNIAETKIFHKPDNASLGLVIYQPILKNIDLPLTLLSLQATVTDKIIISWKTSHEINCAFFEIEKSTNATLFIAIGKVAANNTAQINSYSFTDFDALQNSSVYYRLKMVDKDGRFSYSSIVSVRKNIEKSSIQVYPTVITNSQFVTATIWSNIDKAIDIRLINNEGKTMLNYKERIVIGSNNILLPIQLNLPSGAYYLQFIADGVQQVVKIVK